MSAPTTDRSAPRRNKGFDDTHQQMIETAVRLISASGSDALSIAALASLSDVGGSSANMWGAECTGDPGACRRVSCLHPSICPSFQSDQAAIAELLDAIARLPGVKHVRTASGVRHDLADQRRLERRSGCPTE